MHLTLLQNSQLGFHVDVLSLAGQGILQGLFICPLDAQQQGPVCCEAVDECLENLTVSVQDKIGSCQGGPALLLVCCLQPAQRR